MGTEFDQMRFLMIVTTVLCLSSAANATIGTAVYYAYPYTPSACYQNQDKGKMIAGVSDALWDHRTACGKKYEVRCIGPANKYPHPCHDGATVEVTVVDYCRAMCNGTLNLSQDAFAAIADLKAGKVQVEYKPA